MMELDLPDSWIEVGLDEIASVEWGNTSITKKSYTQEGSVAYSASGPDGYLPDAEWHGDGVVLSAIGAQCGKCFFAKGSWTAIKNTIVIQPRSTGIDSRFLFYYLNDQRRWKISGSGQPFITLKTSRETALPLPPLAEQHRIVAKIEELFSELDQGVVSLKTAREQLKVYRQSLLKNAFEGKLTAAWRAAHRDQLETATALQQRIARERQARYQQQLAAWQAAGQAGSKPKPHKPLPLLTAEELAELPELPAGWGWVSLSQISDSISDGDHQAPPQTAEGIPFITISDIKNQQIDFSDTRFVSQAYFDALSELRRPQKGDVLYSVTGSFGIPCLVDFDRDFCFQRHVALVRTGLHISKKYLFYVLSSRFSYSQAATVATGTAQKTVPLSGLRAMKVPFMSRQEQEQIALEIESKLSEADQLDQALATALQQADALRQSILKKAFHGQLVKQAQNDEPATTLLERIRAARATSPAKGRQAKLGSKSLTNC